MGVCTHKNASGALYEVKMAEAALDVAEATVEGDDGNLVQSMDTEEPTSKL